MARPAVHRITKPAQWAKMMAPVRFELLEAMRAIAPCSAREIALALDRPADALYPHLRALVRVGVVRDMGERPGRTRPERVYDLVADDFRPSFKGSTRANTARVVDRSMRTQPDAFVASPGERTSSARSSTPGSPPTSSRMCAGAFTRSSATLTRASFGATAPSTWPRSSWSR
jgi:hypothetical protein